MVVKCYHELSDMIGFSELAVVQHILFQVLPSTSLVSLAIGNEKTRQDVSTIRNLRSPRSKRRAWLTSKLRTTVTMKVTNVEIL